MGGGFERQVRIAWVPVPSMMAGNPGIESMKVFPEFDSAKEMG